MNTHQNLWYINVLTTHLTKHKIKYYFVLPALLFSAILMSQIFIFNSTFEWVTIKPIAAIGWNRVLFSAFTYLTLGAVLYYLFFYKLLSILFHNVLNDHRSYIKAKRIIWMILMILSYKYVAPYIISILNSILSFLYNMAALIMYILPAVGITLFICTIYIVFNHYKATWR